MEFFRNCNLQQTNRCCNLFLHRFPSFPLICINLDIANSRDEKAAGCLKLHSNLSCFSVTPRSLSDRGILPMLILLIQRRIYSSLNSSSLLNLCFCSVRKLRSSGERDDRSVKRKTARSIGGSVSTAFATPEGPLFSLPG